MATSLSVEELKRRDTVLGMVLDSLFDGVYIVDRHRNILFWNRGAEEMTGYTAEEVTGRCCGAGILNHIDENGYLLCRRGCPVRRTIENGERVEAKLYPLRKSGERFPVRTHMAPIRDADGHTIAAIEVFRDISHEEDFRILQEKFNQIVQRYVSRTTFEEMLVQAQSGGESQAQIRDLTILYLDIVGFTPLSERHTPQEVVMILNSVFGMCDVITRERHGDIDKFIGDAMMAVFLDANDAVSAADQLLREALAHYNRTRAEEGQEPIRVRIGINSGTVLQGDIGSAERKDLTVIGDVVNTAQRIESICAPNSMLLSEASLARLNPETACLFTLEGDVAVKGKETRIRVFRPTE